MKKIKRTAKALEIVLVAMIVMQGRGGGVPDSTEPVPASLNRYAREVCHG